MLKVKSFTFSYFEVNTYLAVDQATNEAAIIDPAMMRVDEQNELDNYIADHGIKLTQIVNTHLHLDHCFGLNYVKNRYGIPLKAHADDAVLGSIIDQQYMMFGIKPKGEKVNIDINLNDGDIIIIGESQLSVLHVPGHTQGGIALYDKEDGILFSGDTLFRGSIGRTDLPGGNQPQLFSSIRNKLFTLPDNVKVYPGHNSPTTIEHERKFNPFV